MKNALILSVFVVLTVVFALPAQADYMAAKQGYYQCVQQCMGDMGQYTPGTNEAQMKYKQCLENACSGAFQAYVEAYQQLCLSDRDHCMQCQSQCDRGKAGCEQNAQNQQDIAQCSAQWETCFEGCLLKK